MNQSLAENIRALRETRSWTQEQLAEAAQITTRTVQRAEAAEGASAETLLAIAGALDVDVEQLRFDAMGFMARYLGVSREALTPELLAQKQKEVAATYATLPMKRITASADLRPLCDTMSMAFECLWSNDDVQDEAALLQRYLGDLLNAGSDLDPVTRRGCETEAFELVARLDQLGAVVTAGLHRHRMVIADKEPIPWTTLYVVVAKAVEAKDFILIPKRQQVRFT